MHGVLARGMGVRDSTDRQPKSTGLPAIPRPTSAPKRSSCRRSAECFLFPEIEEVGSSFPSRVDRVLRILQVVFSPSRPVRVRSLRIVPPPGRPLPVRPLCSRAGPCGCVPSSLEPARGGASQGELNETPIPQPRWEVLLNPVLDVSSPLFLEPE